MLLLTVLALPMMVNAAPKEHKFKNPSFSGVGTSAHYLTIENQTFNRKKAIKEEIKRLQRS